MMRSRIQQARDRIEELRVALLNPAPEEICAALPGLEEAVRCLQTVEQEVRDGACAPYEVRRELKMLKNDLRISGRLVEQGAEFFRGWAKVIGIGTSYTQAGQPSQPEPLAGSGGALSIQG